MLPDYCRTNRPMVESVMLVELSKKTEWAFAPMVFVMLCLQTALHLHRMIAAVGQRETCWLVQEFRHAPHALKTYDIVKDCSVKRGGSCALQSNKTNSRSRLVKLDVVTLPACSLSLHSAPAVYVEYA